MPRRIDILYFASLREAVGTDRERIELPDAVATAAQLRAWLRERGEPWRSALAEGRALRVAVDQSLAQPSSALPDGAEVAFFPPVTGG